MLMLRGGLRLTRLLLQRPAAPPLRGARGLASVTVRTPCPGEEAGASPFEQHISVGDYGTIVSDEPTSVGCSGEPYRRSCVSVGATPP